MSSGKEKRAVIVGAGLAGLAAGGYLEGRGWDVLVLEKEEQEGGRARSQALEGYVFDLGAQFIRDSYDASLKGAIALGLGDTLRFGGNEPALYPDGGPVRFSPRGTNPITALPWGALSARGKMGLARLIADIAREYRDLNVRMPQCWTRGQEQAASFFLRDRYPEEFIHKVAEPLACFGAGSSLSDLSAATFLAISRMVLFDRLGALRGGVGVLAGAMSRELKIVFGMEVLGVDREGGRVVGVRARPPAEGRARHYKADAVVCAVPATGVLDITGALSAEAESLVGGISYSPEVVVNLGIPRDGLSPTGPVLLNGRDGCEVSWMVTHKAKAWDNAPAGSTQVACLFSGASGSRAIDWEKSSLIRASLEAVRRVWGAANVAPDVVRVTPHPQGRVNTGLDHAERLRRYMETGTGLKGLFLAGDWLMSPTMEGAVMSGMMAGRAAAGETPSPGLGVFREND